MNNVLLRYYFVFCFILTALITKAQPDTVEVGNAIDEARSEFSRNPKESKKLAEKALELALACGNEKFIARAYNTLGSAFYFLNFPDSAKAYHLKALEIQKEINDLEGLGRSYTNLGSIYSETGLNEKALSHFTLAEKYFIKINYKVGLAKLYNSLGILFYNIRDFENAKKYFSNGLMLSEELKDEVLSSSLSTNLANTYSSEGKVKEALSLYKTGYDISVRTKNYANIVTVGNSMTELYIGLKDFESAKKYNEEALKIIRDNDLSDYFKISAFGHYAFLLDNDGKYKESINYYDSAVAIARQAQDMIKEIELYKQLSQTLMHNNDYNRAYLILNLANDLKDTLYMRNLKDKISEINAIHNVEKKEQEISVLNKQREDQKKRNVLWVIIACVSLVSLVVAVYSYIGKRKDNELISLQKQEVEKKSIIIEDKQKEIIDSINYAKKIQYALLAHDDFLKANLKEYFVLFKPKDIVSGDFYWSTLSSELGVKSALKLQSESETQNSELFYLAVCDSTGHGVPGAFMSLLNISYLNEAVNEKKIIEPHKIFDHVRNRLIDNISQDGQQDGMDGILICVNKKNKQITYAAANNSPVLISQRKLSQLSTDKMPVGKGERNKPFTLNTIDYKEGDVLYLYTDGYADQFGGINEKKFKYRQLNELLTEIAALPVNKQKQILEERFNEWKGNLDQIDDVCIIGVRL